MTWSVGRVMTAELIPFGSSFNTSGAADTCADLSVACPDAVVRCLDSPKASAAAERSIASSSSSSSFGSSSCVGAETRAGRVFLEDEATGVCSSSDDS
jgi:hypothetical protein